MITQSILLQEFNEYTRENKVGGGGGSEENVSRCF